MRAAASALEAAYETRERVVEDMLAEPGFGTLQHYYVLPLYAHVRFGQWDEVLASDEPPLDLPYPRAVWNYARGLAYVGKGQFDRAEAELAKLRELANDPVLEEITIWDINPMSELVAIAVDVLAGELAARRGDHEAAIARLRAGVEKEAALNYDEPPDWYYPVRHSLGAVLLEADRPAEAEAVYRADLDVFPENGWALFGLWRSLEAQGKKEEAELTRERFERAWRHADVELTASRFI